MPTVSTNDLADYPVGAEVLVDGERLELHKRYQTAEGVAVYLLRPRFDADHGPAGLVRIEVARADLDEPLWEVAPLYAEDPPVYRPKEEGR
ncbi:hypothetical protein [Micromonospora sp. HK10]|uniref:hypothetical protein n=1 Tax=Micromonospora sp. HK10 TaxID=1538294 RepID=UPI000627297A|nr:hypothetical protein [Micromonospora sp. HK10]KKK05548.1 hypothetical protein LQ51_13340 [Micromonospora sp. HK10]